MENEIRARRAERGVSQGALGEAVGVSRQTINAIETGKYLPSLPLAFELARYFGSPIEQLFKGAKTERSGK
jgi:putative transcriptional regulator